MWDINSIVAPLLMITMIAINIEKHWIEINLLAHGPKGYSHQPLDGRQLSTFTKLGAGGASLVKTSTTTYFERL